MAVVAMSGSKHAVCCTVHRLYRRRGGSWVCAYLLVPSTGKGATAPRPDATGIPFTAPPNATSVSKGLLMQRKQGRRCCSAWQGRVCERFGLPPTWPGWTPPAARC